TCASCAASRLPGLPGLRAGAVQGQADAQADEDQARARVQDPLDAGMAEQRSRPDASRPSTLRPVMEAAAAIVASSTVSCSIGAPIGTNWGSRAVKNAAAFGLRRLLTRPWAKESPRN